MREAARRVLGPDGRDLALQPWQAAWLIATGGQGRWRGVGARVLARRLARVRRDAGVVARRSPAPRAGPRA